MELNLEGRIALVVGGTAGLGLAVGRALAGEGVHVALAGRRRELAEQEAKAFSRGIGVEMDVRDAESVARALEQVGSDLGPPDILILNSGGPPPSRAIDLDTESLQIAGELLLYGPLQLVNSCLPKMRDQGWGRIVAIGSTSVQQPIPLLASSSIFRAAVASYLKLLAEDVASEGITVNMVHPGRLATDRTIQIDKARAEHSKTSMEEVKAAAERLIPLGRYGTPEEFAAMVTFLCGDGARYITGEQIRVDGGLIRST
ncbi:MAG TPA: SDR family oxidoreductase [Acidimicrobiales bacterium]|nr:SDR family oxidoreductase [Acidimicrobiales bacterium]